MAISVRDLLDELPRDALVRLIYARNLPSSRSNDERRKTLAHSYHGKMVEFLDDLLRKELIELFRIDYSVDEHTYALPNATKYAHDELLRIAKEFFVRGKVPAEFCPQDYDDDYDEDDESDDVDDEEEEDEDEDDEEESADDQADDGIGEDEEVPIAELLRVDSEEWSRPRMVGRILRELGEEEPQRLRTPRFQELIATLHDGGMQACLADDRDERVLSTSDESPGIYAKLRLRLHATGSAESSGERDSASRPARSAIATTEGGPRIVLQSGEKPIPQQVARPSDYKLAVLRLQFLTAVPTAERGSLPAWPDGYLLAATRGLSLRDQERSLLRAYAAGLCLGNHSPYDAITPLSQVLSAGEWEGLLADFEVLNPFQQELVRAIVDLVAPVTAPRSQPGSWRAPTPVPADMAPADAPLASPQPMAASGRGGAPADTVRDDDPPNKRDLGALAGMFDDE